MSTPSKAKIQPIEEKPKAKYHLRNWAQYNENLKQRGRLTLWIDEDVIAEETGRAASRQ